MSKNYVQGKFKPKNPQKYKGDPTNIIYRSGWELKFLFYCDKNENILEYSSEEIVIPYFSKIENKYRRYFVDFYIKVKEKNGRISEKLVEIKPYIQTVEPVIKENANKKSSINRIKTWINNNEKWEAAKKYANSRGWDFLILTERQLFNK